jgi:hypothetical protein
MSESGDAACISDVAFCSCPLTLESGGMNPAIAKVTIIKVMNFASMNDA